MSSVSINNSFRRRKTVTGTSWSASYSRQCEGGWSGMERGPSLARKRLENKMDEGTCKTANELKLFLTDSTLRCQPSLP